MNKTKIVILKVKKTEKATEHRVQFCTMSIQNNTKNKAKQFVVPKKNLYVLY